MRLRERDFSKNQNVGAGTKAAPDNERRKIMYLKRYALVNEDRTPASGHDETYIGVGDKKIRIPPECIESLTMVEPPLEISENYTMGEPPRTAIMLNLKIETAEFVKMTGKEYMNRYAEIVNG